MEITQLISKVYLSNCLGKNKHFANLFARSITIVYEVEIMEMSVVLDGVLNKPAEPAEDREFVKSVT